MEATERKVAVLDADGFGNPDLIMLELTELYKNMYQSTRRSMELIDALRTQGFTLEVIEGRLRQAGIVGINKSTLSRQQNTYSYYCKQKNLCDYLDKVGWTILYTIMPHFQERLLSGKEIQKFLDAIIEQRMTRENAELFVCEQLGTCRGEESQFKTLKLDASVYDRWAEWKARLSAAAQTAGDTAEELSDTEVMEKTLEMVDGFEHKKLVEIWRAMHGEV